MDSINTTLIPLAKVLAEQYLVVPKYQRSYAWEDSNVTDLLDDITNAIADGNTEYFLGSIVLTGETNDQREVIDGQQRLATATIIVAVIRDFFVENGDEARASGLEAKYLFDQDIYTQEQRLKLKLNVYDHSFFANRIVWRSDATSTPEQPQRDSHERLLRAKSLIQRHVKVLAQTTSNPTNILLNWVRYLSESTNVIKVEVPTHANAYVIFETLNDRGLALSTADLLKNYLFGLAGDRVDEVQQKWSAMLGALETVGGEKITLNYIRHLWSSYYGATRDKELYSSIKRKINSKQQSVDFATQLEEAAKLYAALLNPDNSIWDEYGDTARGHILTLNFLGIEQVRPLLLALLEKFSVKETKTTLKYLVSLAVRLLITGGGGGGTMEKVYAENAKAVRSESLKTAKNLSDEMIGVAPTDRAFEDAFASARVSKNALGRYYLRVLERQNKGEEPPELVPNMNREEVNLEHVLPTNPSATWKVTEEIARAYNKRIGNLALLQVNKNSSLGNENFETKKPIFAESSFGLTQNIAEKEIWGPNEIENRQRQLAALAVQAWSLR